MKRNNYLECKEEEDTIKIHYVRRSKGDVNLWRCGKLKLRHADSDLGRFLRAGIMSKKPINTSKKLKCYPKKTKLPILLSANAISTEVN